MKDRLALGLRIKELRKARALSQEALAERMEVHPKYLGSVERGEQNPTFEFIEKTAGALKVDVPALFNYPWQKMGDAELKRKLHALIDKSNLETLRELLALLKARDL